MPTPTAERPPVGLSADWLGVWRHALKVMKQQESWTWEQAPLLAEYVYALREAKTARELAESDPFHQTDQGLLHPHPGFAVADRCVKRAAQLAKLLRLTHEEQEKLRKARAAKPEVPTPKKAKTAAEEFAELDELAPRRARSSS
jgi:hypothetical protein